MLLALGLLALQVLALPGAHGAPRARVELLSGRAALAGTAGVEALAPAGPARELEGPGYLELAALGRASLRWAGLGSAELRGPAILEWGAGEAPLELRLLSFRDLHLEVRRGPAWLELPGGWRASVENGACYLAQLPTGQVELQHDAGRPLLLFRPSSGVRARPPLTVLPGARLRLDPSQPRPLELVKGGRLLDPFGRPEPARRSPPPAPPWDDFAWPWDPSRQGAPGPADEDGLPLELAAARPGPGPTLDLPNGTRAGERPLASAPAPAPPEPPAASLPSLGAWRVRREGRLQLGPWGVDWAP